MNAFEKYAGAAHLKAALADRLEKIAEKTMRGGPASRGPGGPTRLDQFGEAPTQVGRGGAMARRPKGGAPVKPNLALMLRRAGLSRGKLLALLGGGAGLAGAGALLAKRMGRKAAPSSVEKLLMAIKNNPGKAAAGGAAGAAGLGALIAAANK